MSNSNKPDKTEHVPASGAAEARRYYDVHGAGQIIVEMPPGNFCRTGKPVIGGIAIGVSWCGNGIGGVLGIKDVKQLINDLQEWLNSVNV